MRPHPEPPPLKVEIHALNAGAQSTCNTRRGAVVFTRVDSTAVHPAPTRILATGRNYHPIREHCRGACSRIAVHAELAAILNCFERPFGAELVHVRLNQLGGLDVSGPPRCADCAKAIVAAGFIRWVWLFHAGGWRAYEPTEFYDLSLLSQPVAVAS